jgi:hypothetical protein
MKQDYALRSRVVLRRAVLARIPRCAALRFSLNLSLRAVISSTQPTTDALENAAQNERVLAALARIEKTPQDLKLRLLKIEIQLILRK